MEGRGRAPRRLCPCIRSRPESRIISACSSWVHIRKYSATCTISSKLVVVRAYFLRLLPYGKLRRFEHLEYEYGVMRGERASALGIKNALREATQFYVQLSKLGFGVEFIDIGGPCSTI